VDKFHKGGRECRVGGEYLCEKGCGVGRSLWACGMCECVRGVVVVWEWCGVECGDGVVGTECLGGSWGCVCEVVGVLLVVVGWSGGV
jgi:hypothetical protein